MNLYWPIYLRLEEEIIDLTRSITFCDDQINVFSSKITDLVLRCAVEIESVSKELFNREFSVGDEHIFKTRGSDVKAVLDSNGFWIKKDKDFYYPHFDHHCLRFLIDKWGLNNRKIDIVSINMTFSEDTNSDIFPLSQSELNDSYSNETGNPGGWLKAYQEIKHNRSKGQTFGSIYHMMNVLGALFILNIYYREEVILKDVVSQYTESHYYFDLTCGSQIFTTTKGKSEKDIFLSQLNGILEINKNQSVWEVQCDEKGRPLGTNYIECDHPDGYEHSVLIGVETPQLSK